MELLLKGEVYALQGAIFEVSREMGIGFLEAVYQECLTREFDRLNIPFEAQKPINLAYKGEVLNQLYQPDFICYGQIIIELKCVSDINDAHRAQILNYLKATGLRVGLLVNFGRPPKARIERFIL